MISYGFTGFNNNNNAATLCSNYLTIKFGNGYTPNLTSSFILALLKIIFSFINLLIAIWIYKSLIE
jgi:hypothetical protein